ncbi:hypothetical protein B0H21DRAFT_205986 [Amylocystis lapponica]|nr:hypothetical protein B0H21DRAFT_205986 [Amylocystis lapponica]
MNSRVGRRLLSQVVRPNVRIAGRNAGARQRLMSTAEHGEAKQGSDTPWMIGSAVIFGPAFIYLLSPSSKKASHGSVHAHKPASAPPPVKDDEGTEVPAAGVEDAQVSEEQQPSEESPMTDADGEKISGDEVKESMKQAFNEDSPQDAQNEEEEDAKFNSGSPGQTSEAEINPDQKERPSDKPRTGTLQSDEESGPTNLGDAREKATVCFFLFDRCDVLMIRNRDLTVR